MLVLNGCSLNRQVIVITQHYCYIIAIEMQNIAIHNRLFKPTLTRQHIAPNFSFETYEGLSYTFSPS